MRRLNIFLVAVSSVFLAYGVITLLKGRGDRADSATQSGKDITAYLLQTVYPIHLDKLLDLASYDNHPVAEEFDTGFALISFFGSGSCSTCVSEVLGAVANMRKRQGHRLGFVTLTYGVPKEDLRAYRRTGLITGPLLIEDQVGSIGLPNQFCIALVDTRTHQALISFLPDMNSKSLFPAFEKLVMGKVSQADGP